MAGKWIYIIFFVSSKKINKKKKNYNDDDDDDDDESNKSIFLTLKLQNISSRFWNMKKNKIFKFLYSVQQTT